MNIKTVAHVLECLVNRDYRPSSYILNVSLIINRLNSYLKLVVVVTTFFFNLPFLTYLIRFIFLDHLNAYEATSAYINV